MELLSGLLKWLVSKFGFRAPLVLSSLCLVVGMVFTTSITIYKAWEGKPLKICSIPLNGKSEDVALLFGNPYFAFVMVMIIGVPSLILWGQIMMFLYPIQTLSSNSIVRPLSSTTDTLLSACGMLLSFLSSVFTGYIALHFISAFLIVLWAFFLQMFLKPKTNFGLFSCVGSAAFTILTNAVHCHPKTIWEGGICVIGFVGYHYLYYYYSHSTGKTEPIVIRCKQDTEIERGWGHSSVRFPEAPQNLILTKVDPENPPRSYYNHLFIYLKPFGGVIGRDYEIVAGSSYSPEVRDYLLETGGYEWKFLKNQYMITVDAPETSSQSYHNPPPQSSSSSRLHSGSFSAARPTDEYYRFRKPTWSTGDISRNV